MNKKLLEFNIPHPLPEDYDPILGRSVGDIRPIASEVPLKNSNPAAENTSVFDNPDLDFSYQSPIKEELPQLSAEDIAIILNDEGLTDEPEAQEEVIISDESVSELIPNEPILTEPESAPVAEILSNDLELAPEITPFETMDGSANEAINQADEENNLSDRWRMIDDEILEEQKEEIIGAAPEQHLEEIVHEEAITSNIADIEDVEEEPISEDITETETEIEAEIEAEIAPEPLTTTESSEVISDEMENSPAVTEETNEAPSEPVSIQDAIVEPTTEIAPEKPKELFNDPILAPPPEPKKRRPKGKKRRNAKRTNEFALMGGVFFTGMAFLFLMSTLAAPLGRPFSDIASYGIIWSGFAIIGAMVWAFIRNWQMVIVSLLCLLGFVVNIMPAIGDAPIGGSGETNVIGWANVENSPKALQSFVSQGEKNGASLLIVAGANKLIAGDITNWSVIQVPIANDATSLAVLAKDNWRAVTLPGEPTMARPLDNSITVIGVNPSFGAPKDNAIINRAANRMGDQETAVLTIGDFGVVPWDRTMKDFSKTSGAKRIRCGGILGTTYNQGFLGIATDHVFGFNAKVQECDIGNTMPQSRHKPLFVKVLKNN